MPTLGQPRVLQVVHGLYPQATGGVELYAWELARELGGAVLSLMPRPVDAAPEPLWAGFSVYTPAPGEGVAAAWRRTLDTVQPEVVLVHHLGSAPATLLLDLRERSIPYAIFLHDFTALCPTHRLWHRRDQLCSGPGRTGLKCALCVSGSLRRGIEVPWRAISYRHRPEQWRTALLGAEVLIANSRFLRDAMAAEGAPPERIVVIAPCVPDTAAAPAPETARRLDLLYAGGCGEAKGSGLLAAGLEHVKRPMRVAIAGPWSALDRTAFRALVPARHLLEFTGVVDPAQMPALLAACTAVAVPSRWNETYSRVIHEAHLAGTAVVATAVGGMAERVIHGVNGFLAEPDEPASLGLAIEEATETGGHAEDLARASAFAVTEADHAMAQLRRLLQLLASASAVPSWDLALELEHGEWRRSYAREAGIEPSAAARQLTAALRQQGGPDPADGVEAEAWSGSQRRRLHLNFAVASLRGRQIVRVASPSGAMAPDAAVWFTTWGLEVTENADLADAIFEDCESLPEPDIPLLRRRFPAATHWIGATHEGVEIETLGATSG